MDPTGHCTNSGSNLLDPTAYKHFSIYLHRGAKPPPVQLGDKMHADCWIQQVTSRVGAVTCWIQQSVPPKQVVGFSCLFNSEVDQLTTSLSFWLTICATKRPDVRTPDVRTSGRLDDWTSGRPDVRTSGRPDVRTSGRPAVWSLLSQKES